MQHPGKLDLQPQVQILKANMARWKQRQGSKRQSISWALFQATGGDNHSILPQHYRCSLILCGFSIFVHLIYSIYNIRYFVLGFSIYKCILCAPNEPAPHGSPALVVYKPANGTGGLTTHFSKHPGLLEGWKKELDEGKRVEADAQHSSKKRQKIGSMRSFLTNRPSYDGQHPKQEEFEKWFLLWMAKSYAPLRSTEDKWFRRMIHCLDPQIFFRSRSQLRKNLLPTFVSDSDLKVKQSLAHVVAVVVCFDLWMSRGAQVSM